MQEVEDLSVEVPADRIRSGGPGVPAGMRNLLAGLVIEVAHDPEHSTAVWVGGIEPLSQVGNGLGMRGESFKDARNLLVDAKARLPTDDFQPW